MARLAPTAEIWVPVSKITELTGGKPADLDNDFDVSSKKLAQKAKQTLWHELPLRAIAEAHKRQAESLLPRGGLNDNATVSNNTAICLEYHKYLQLSPDRDSDDYRRVFQRVHQLEQAFDGPTGLAIPDSEPHLSVNGAITAVYPISERHSESMKWMFFILGLVTATIVPYFVRWVSRW
ncbi:hypothetical protein MVEN_00795300 [Mycena venus]|uniref:Uncharacterized protein n=1 Tax=Mycena venus TaxID=2733690 RepID=A0A8H6YLW2_9AGAR|nr:hypothetical protein MVEN_00795300 [Mycena venus]